MNSQAMRYLKWDQVGRLFTYKKEGDPSAETYFTVAIYNEQTGLWRVDITKNKNGTYFNGDDRSVKWFGYDDAGFGVYATSGIVCNTINLGGHLVKYEMVGPVPDTGLPAGWKIYSHIPEAVLAHFFPVSACWVQEIRKTLLPDGEPEINPAKWGCEYSWETIYCPYTGKFEQTLKAQYWETTGPRLIHETWYHLKNVGVVKIDRKTYWPDGSLDPNLTYVIELDDIS